tara:strand:+ start:14345 stop:14983 length:639 start_codon:yes stop_codon:yes gene_type:complete
MTYYLPDGRVWTGDTHTMTDGSVMSGATHTSESKKLVTEKSNANPHIKSGFSPLRTLCMSALRRYGEFSPGTVDGDVLLMFIEFANMVIDDIRMHPYAPTKNDTDSAGTNIVVPVTFDYYEGLDDVREIDDVIIVQGILYHYAMQQGSEKLQFYMPMYHRTLNQQLWRRLNGYTIRYKEKEDYDRSEPYANLELLNRNTSSSTSTSYTGSSS